MHRLIDRFENHSFVPNVLKQIAWARSIRWFGWGVIEPLLPIFLLTFSGTLTETGILRSVYDLSFLFLLPFATSLSDRISSKTILLSALVLYPFVGLNYALAGMSGVGFFVVLARIINGCAYCLDSIGTDTFLRRHSFRTRLASSFGYVDAVSNVAWILSALVSIMLVNYLPLYTLFFAVSLTSLVAFFFITRLSNDRQSVLRDEVTSTFKVATFWALLREIMGWPTAMKSYAAITFFEEMLYVVGSFLIPIIAYKQGMPMTEVVLVSIILAIPWIFAYHIGKFSDYFGNKRALRIGMLCLVVTFVISAITHGTAPYLILTVVLGTIEVLITVNTKTLITKSVHPDHYGRTSGLMEGISKLASLVSPIVLGLVFDYTGAPILFLFLSILTIGLYSVLELTTRHQPDHPTFTATSCHA